MKLKNILNLFDGNIAVFDRDRVEIGSTVMNLTQTNDFPTIVWFNDIGRTCDYRDWIKPFENCEVTSIISSEQFVGDGEHYEHCLTDDGVVITIEVTPDAEKKFIKNTGRRRMTREDWALYVDNKELELDILAEKLEIKKGE